MPAIRALACCLLLFFAAGCSKPDSSQAVGHFFVATNGNDTWSGTLVEPAKDGRDGPFATVARALSAAQDWNTRLFARDRATISIRQGTYFLSEPLKIGPAHSGIRLSGYAGERPILSGGRAVTGWRWDALGGRKVMVTEVPEAMREETYFRQLWINGRRAIRARTPDRGFYPVLAVPDEHESVVQGHSSFGYMSSHLASWPTIGQAEVVVMNRWTESRLPVTHVDELERMVYCSKKSVFALMPGDLYYLEGNLEGLDQPGEWFLDRRTGRLYYLPLPGEEPETLNAVAPRLSQLLLVAGDSATARYVKDVSFKDLTFAHTEWYFPAGFEVQGQGLKFWPLPKKDVGGFAQAAAGVPAAFQAEGLLASTVSNCTFAHLGGYALQLGAGCRRNTVEGSEFYDLGAGGIRVGETTIPGTRAELAGYNQITDCHIHEAGRFFHSGVGIWVGQSPGNTISRNHIHDLFQIGVSVGWTWGYAPAIATNTTVAANHIHHIGMQTDGTQPILSDLAAVYTLGLQTGSLIANNYIHDVAAYRYGGSGIYFDEGTSYIRAVSNLVAHTSHGGFQQHYGVSNTIENNIFAFGRVTQIMRVRDEPHISFFFRTNIVYSDDGHLLTGFFTNNFYRMDYNLYFDARTNAAELDWHGSGTWEVWQQRGHDLHSLRVNPLFVAPESNNFSLRPESPAFKLGFRPIDLRAIGPKPNRESR
jgi:hypothetical protein